MAIGNREQEVINAPSFRSALVLAAAVLTLAAACSTGGATTADAGAPVTGGSLTWGVETEPITF
ncbi:hypothetical protein ACWKSP_32585, partial [Micromonosporaceae bacterium Da 78-11]